MLYFASPQVNGLSDSRSFAVSDSYYSRHYDLVWSSLVALECIGDCMKKHPHAKYELSNSPKEFSFWTFHFSNPKIYQLFIKYALVAVSRSKRKLSGWYIVNRIRWEEEIEKGNEAFMISNDFIAFYTRLFVKDYPHYANMFTLKKMKE